MGEFFKGWRRRIGLLTLLISCVFMVGWVRSQNFVDLVVFPGKIFPKGNSIFSCASTDSAVECQRLWGDSDASNFSGVWKSFPNDAHQRAHRHDGYISEWHRGWCGFLIDEGRWGQPTTHRLRVWVVPYWSIVIPLTLLSAWLLLSKPRVAKPTAGPKNEFMGKCPS